MELADLSSPAFLALAWNSWVERGDRKSYSSENQLISLLRMNRIAKYPRKGSCVLASKLVFQPQFLKQELIQMKKQKRMFRDQLSFFRDTHRFHRAREPTYPRPFPESSLSSSQSRAKRESQTPSSREFVLVHLEARSPSFTSAYGDPRLVQEGKPALLTVYPRQELILQL
jgi:hypothetical protein